MKRIRLTESQVHKLKETLNSKQKKQVIKITETQYKKLTENVKLNHKSKNTLGEISELEFFEQMMYFLENMNSGSNKNVPEILATTGISSQKLKELLIGHGILKIVKTDDGLVPKIQGNGISKSLGKLLGDIQKQYGEKVEEKEEITEESGYYPAGSEYDPNAPYNQHDEEDDLGSNISIIDEYDGYALIQYNDDKQYNIVYVDNMGPEFTKYKNREVGVDKYMDTIDYTDNVKDYFDDFVCDGLILNRDNIDLAYKYLKSIQNDLKSPPETIREDYPAGSEHDPNAPYNQPEEEQIPYGDIIVNRIIDKIDDFTIIDTDSGFILAYDVNHGDDDSYDNPERNISQNLSQMTISTDPYEFVNGETNAVYLNNETLGIIGGELSEDFPELSQALSRLGGNFISEEENILNENGSNPLELIIFLQDHEAYEALDLLKEKGPDSVVQYLSQWDNGDGGEETDSDSFGSGDKTYETDNYIMIYNTSYGYVGLYKKMSQLDEMTTTGSVGGSFETPAAWSKNPKKPRHSDKTSLHGGKFIKPSIGDKMDPIRK